MKFDPKTIFYLTLFCMIGQGISSGTVHLSGLIPADSVAPVTGWISLLTFIALAFLSLATGYAGVGKGPLAAPATPAEIKKLSDQAQK
jgi:hypothetical protein